MAVRKKYTVEDIPSHLIEADLDLHDEGVKRKNKLVNTLQEFGTKEERQKNVFVNRVNERLKRLHKKYSRRGYFKGG